MRRRFDSSTTRVRPLFAPLLDSANDDWLPRLLGAAPHAARLPPEVIAAPGALRPELRSGRPQAGSRAPLARAFEVPVPPPTAFLRYLLTHPDVLTWPCDHGQRRKFGRDTTRRRQALIDGPDDARAAMIREGVAELERVRGRGSRRKWWAFEGFTSVDCYVETDRLVLLIEGKRTEALSTSTDWYPKRNQLVRNLEAVGEIAAGRAAGVLLVSEQPLPELTDDEYARSLPHLDAARPPGVRSASP